MSNSIIQIKRTATAANVPSINWLSNGEIFINFTDGKLYAKAANGTVILLNPSYSGGSITIPGNIGEVLIANNGVLNVSSNLSSTSDGYLFLEQYSVGNSAPQSNTMNGGSFFTRRRGKLFPSFAAYGEDKPMMLQFHLGTKYISTWIAYGGSVATCTSINFTSAIAGTANARAFIPQTGTYINSMSRLGLRSAGTAGATAGIRDSTPHFSRNRGLYFTSKFGISEVQGTNSRWFVGLANTNANMGNVSPQSFANTIAFGSDMANTNVFFLSCDATAPATMVDLGPEFPAKTNGACYQVHIYCPSQTANNSNVYWAIERLDTPAYAEGSTTTKLPIGNAVLLPQISINNGGILGNVAIDVSSIWIEKD